MKKTFTMPEISNALSFPVWARLNLWIITMQGEMVPLDLNIAQRKVHATLELQHKAGLPMRVIILKARREGVSTYIEGYSFREINKNPMRYACVCSADIDATNKVFKMAKLFQDKIPEDIRLPTEFSNRKEIVYSAPHRSEFLCQTAGKSVLGRGGLNHFLHCTEFAFWDKAKEQLGGAAQEVPDDPDTLIALESTAHGVGGAFYDIFDTAVRDWRETKDLHNFLPIFLPWYIFPAYSMDVGADFALDSEESEISKQFNLTDRQMMWRRWAIKNKCMSDLSLFKQEFPGTWQEAFQSTGNAVFTIGMIGYQEARLARNPRYCVFTGTQTNVGIEDVDRKFNCWQIAKLPKSEDEYALGIDTMEGRLSDVQDVKSKLDCHGAAILNRRTGDFDAIYHGRGSQIDIGRQCLLAARFYHGAWTAPEIPAGMVVLNVFKEAGYENIYSRQVHEQRIDVQDSEDLGWRTDLVTRKWLVNDFVTALRDKAVRVTFSDFLDEMRTFIHDKNGKPIHMAGKKDDILFSGMIALQVHQRCPLETKTYGYDHTGEDVERDREKSLAFSGAVDDFEPGEEYEDE